MSSEEKNERPANILTGNAGPGTGLLDLLPIPASTQPVTEPHKTEHASTLRDDPSLSHALATDDHDEKGQAQQDHDEEVLDLGWNEKKEYIAAPLVGGMDNEELWLLIRRFDKQMYHVKAVPSPVPGGLDLNIADEEEFSPDKLRANIERLYMTVLVGVLGAVKHIARLRSWRETRRTACFTAVYAVAWIFDLVVPMFSAVIILLIVYPPSRDILFPPAPLSLVNASGGGIQKPKSGVLGSHDSATGAPENHKGEAVEQEASNFVNGIASVALSSATGKHPHGDDSAAESKGGAIDSIPDPTSLAVSAADGQANAKGDKTGAQHDKTKIPMETAMWTKMRPVMHGLADLTDTWERFANALSPTAPFPRDTYRVRLALVIVPLFLMSLFVTNYMVVKGTTFGAGFAFFGDPVISRSLVLLNRTFPNWQKLLELRNTLLKGVPTNAQLTITLLRIGEANKAPLPPPPRVDEAPPEKPAEITNADLRTTLAEPPFNATEEELDDAMQHDPSTKHETTGADIDAAKEHKHGKKSTKILNFFRGASKGAVKTSIAGDSLRAKLGSHHAKDRLGAVPPKDENFISGPVDFKGRYDGKKGHVYLVARATIPAIAFSTDSSIQKIGSQEREDLHPIWSIAIADIIEMKKFGGYGWKAKIVVGWALGREVADGLEITVRSGEKHKITALPLRDELFNRLIAMGGQKWESCILAPLFGLPYLQPNPGLYSHNRQALAAGGIAILMETNIAVCASNA